MRILFSANPMYGHVNPMLPLAATASKAGHDVRFATGPDIAGHVSAHGVDVAEVGPAYADVRTDPDELFIPFFARLARRRAGDLFDLTGSWAPDVVIHEETDLAGAAAAASAAAGGAVHLVHGLGMPPPARIFEVLRAELGALGADLSLPDLGRRLEAATYLQPWPPSLELGEPLLWSRVVRMRPTLATPATEDRAGAGIDTDLRHPRSVHVTLGTVFNDRTALLRQMAEAVARLPVNVLVTTGSSVDPAALATTHPDIHVHRYLPYDVLLPLCSAVVSHGGAGVVIGSVVHGLPQLHIPQGADQHANARACVAAGVGLALLDGEVGTDAITSAVERLLDDPSYAAAASAIGDEIRAMPGPGRALEEITALTCAVGAG